MTEFFITAEWWLLLIIENGLNLSIDNIFFVFFVILFPVPVQYETDVQNPHPTDGDFSWLCRIPKN